MPRVPMEALIAFGTDLLVKMGLAESDARHVASMAALTEARGMATHGMILLVKLEEQDVAQSARPRVIKEKPATALINGAHCVGQLCLRLAVEIAGRKAREQGIAMVAIRNTSWVAGLGPYLLTLAEQGFLAQLWAQNSGCRECAPVGGIDGRFSTDPVALAIPAPEGPIMADFRPPSCHSAERGCLLPRIGEHPFQCS